MQNNNLAALGGAGPTLAGTLRGIAAALFGEEQPRQMLVLLTVLVLLMHLWLLLWLLRPVEKITQAQPLIMEVSMIAIAAPKPAVAPPAPAPPPPEKKPPPKKVPPKPLVKKPPPIVQKSPDFAPSEPIAPPPPVQQTTETNSSPVVSQSTNKTSAEAEQFTEANFRANYAHNPKPDYPAIAKSRGWQGKVLLRVQVSAEGLSDSVAVDKSSGHEILDESAVEAVKQWKFIPAKRGETPIASSVIVPIIFTLRN